jgi:hypothetical protein
VADDVRHQVAIVESPVRDYVEICGSEFDVKGGGYYVFSVDLDGDGLADQMFANTGTSGTGGRAATVYLARLDGRFTRVGTLGHGAISRVQTEAGDSLLQCSWNWGGGEASITTYALSHNGIQRIEASDGEWRDPIFRESFEKTFRDALSIPYKFVANDGADRDPAMDATTATKP